MKRAGGKMRTPALSGDSDMARLRGCGPEVIWGEEGGAPPSEADDARWGGRPLHRLRRSPSPVNGGGCSPSFSERGPMTGGGFVAVVCARSAALGGDVAEGGDDFAIDGALEGDDQFGKALQSFPAPLGEFRLEPALAGMEDVDFAVLAGEAEGEPFLLLAAISAAP